jgi:hypothetical protein
VQQIKPFKVWETSTAGTFDFQTIFDNAGGHRMSGEGAVGHVWRCLLVTNNGAHAKGRLFTAITNGYSKAQHSSFPHRILDVTDLDYGASGGCSEGLTSFDLSDQTGFGSGGGKFTFSPGNCKQVLTLHCRGPFVIDDDGVEETEPLVEGECGAEKVADTVDALSAFKFTAPASKTTDEIVDKIKPFTVFPPTRVAGTYDLRAIFDDARREDGLKPHTYRCMLLTSNGAHFLGKLFTITVNYYTETTHASFPHRIYDVVDLDVSD